MFYFLDCILTVAATIGSSSRSTPYSGQKNLFKQCNCSNCCLQHVVCSDMSLLFMVHAALFAFPGDWQPPAATLFREFTVLECDAVSFHCGDSGCFVSGHGEGVLGLCFVLSIFEMCNPCLGDGRRYWRLYFCAWTLLPMLLHH